jgi:hypothetical protein
LKHQLKVAEQETNILRTKTNNLEQENEKLLAEIKKNQLQTSRNIIKESNSVDYNKENDALKAVSEKLKNECEQLKLKLKLFESGPFKLPERSSKIYSDSSTKFQLKVSFNTIFFFLFLSLNIFNYFYYFHFKKMIDELENEVLETRVIVSKCISNEQNNMRETNNKLKEEINHLQARLDANDNEMSKYELI